MIWQTLCSCYSSLGQQLGKGVFMVDVRRILGRIAAMLFCLQAALSLSWLQAASGLEEIVVSYAGSERHFPARGGGAPAGLSARAEPRIKLLLTRSEVDRAALVSGSVDYTLRAGSSFVSAARGLPVRIVLLGTMKPFWGLARST